METLQDR